MKILIISDTHLGRFNKKRFAYMQKIILEHDKVIINGDLYEGYLYSLSQFAKSKWSALFPLLKQKHAIYIYGNHDNPHWLTYDEQNILATFSDEQHFRYSLTLGNTTYNIEHGHLLFPFLDTKLNWKPPRWLALFGLWLDTSLGNIFGRSIYYAIAKLYNIKLKLIIQTTKQDGAVYIVGHTHWGEIDLKQRFINSGVNKHNFGQYVTLTEEDVTLTTVPRFRNYQTQIVVSMANEDTKNYNYINN